MPDLLAPPWNVIVPLVVGVLLVPILVAFSRRRRRTYERYCRAKGFRYEMTGGDAESLPRVFELLDPKREGQWFNRITGQWNGVPFTAVDYYWGDASTGSAGSWP